MKTFAYNAYTDKGRHRRGKIQAVDEATAAQRLTTLGLIPGKIEEVKSRGGVAPGPRRARKIDAETLSVFTRQFVVLLGAGLTVEMALDAVQEAAGSSRAGQFAVDARSVLLEGGSLAEALESAAGGLPPWYLAAVRSGERAGELLAVFSSLADHLETRAGDRAAVATALVYPAFVTVVALTVCGVLMVTVLPEIVSMFETSGQPLPTITVVALAVIDGLRTGWPWLLAAGIAVIFAVRTIARNPVLRARRDALLLRVPLIGRFMRMASAAAYLRTFALVVNSRLPLIEALQHAGEVLAIGSYRREADEACQMLKRGDSLATALGGVSFLYPVARQLLQAGEASGKLGPISSRAADLAENWLAVERKRFNTILEPAAMVLVGLLVMSVIMAILLPIFDLQSVIAL